MSLITDISALFHHYPRSLHDLMHHEDKTLLAEGLPGIRAKPAGSVHSNIEKDLDPAIARSQQNFGLLVRDYLHTLPEYSSQTEAGEALLRHWRKILMEQPQRLAESHMDSWNNERSRHFWQDRLKHYHTDFGIHADHFPTAMDDWERSAGAVTPPPEALRIMKTKQWQDLLIRQRIHNLDLYNMSH